MLKNKYKKGRGFLIRLKKKIEVYKIERLYLQLI